MAFQNHRITIAVTLLTSLLCFLSSVFGDHLQSQLILDACNETALLADLQQPCIQTLSSDQRTAAAEAPTALTRATIILAAEKAEKVVELLGTSPTEPRLKFCAEGYKDLMESLRKAEKMVGGEDGDGIDEMLDVARDSADYCSNLLTDKNSAVFVANQEVFRLVIFAMSAADLI